MDYVRETERIGLRPMTIEDSPLIVRWRNQDWVREHYIYRETFTLEGQEAYYHNKVETGLVVQFIACERETGRPIGCAVLNSDDEGWEYGMFLGEVDATGKGYGSEIMRMTLDYAFREMDLEEVHSKILADNGRCIKSVGNIGIQISGTLPHVLCSDGIERDMVTIRMRREDFI